MRNFTKRQRRWFVALVSFLVFWLAYDIWDHSRHPIFWGLSYLVRVPMRHADTTVKDGILSKIHSEGFFISKGSMTNVEKLNVSRIEPGTTNLIWYSEVRTNTYDGFRLSDGGSNSAFLHEAPRDGDELIRLSSNSLLMVNMNYFNDYVMDGWQTSLRLIVLDSRNGSYQTTLLHSSSRNRGNCTLSRDVNGLIFCKLATGFDYLYAAIDEKMTRMRGEIWFVDRRGYWDDKRNSTYYPERDLSEIIYSWELASLDFADAVTWRGKKLIPVISTFAEKLVEHPTTNGWLTIDWNLIGVSLGTFAFLSRRFRELARRHRRLTIAAITLALGSLAFAVLFLFV